MCWFFKKKKKEIPKISKKLTRGPLDKTNPKTTIEDDVKYSGKYELYPEAGLFKYRLKASNGEILIVSSGYASIQSAKAGIKTFKKSVKNENIKFVTDKFDYSQFRLYTVNGARLIASGEYYDSMSGAESAFESVKKFYKNNKYLQLKKIPQSEIREEVVKLKRIEKIKSGKYEIFRDGKQWKASLIASNGQVLFVTSGYSSRSNLLQGIETIKNEIAHDSFRVSCDKQNRYQFKIYSSNNQQLLVGETYSNKSDAFSSVDSVRRFATYAKIVDL
jgi:uncharacterized protein